ncbi:hypothetical protein LN042_17465 [Kitasatospora sp. RB6PN24]|uniref:hypothetical protein n=1 Tax=Kitasatospora humi TaxID=2893891 RepID=UPI001E52EAA6|nr:hypothetical protein [Kitasatospora humi]MCC9308853.1 hypothetical protein [Kitasatospora humi]
MALRKRAAGLLAAGAMLAATGLTQLALAGPAAAMPPCERSWTNSSGEVICPGYANYRADIECVHAGTPYWVYGEAVSAGQLATADCNFGDQLKNATAPTETVYWEILS